MVKKGVFILLVAVFATGGLFAGKYLVDLNIITFPENLPQLKMGIWALGTLIGVIVGILTAPWLMRSTIWITGKIEHYFQKTPTQDLIMGSVGLIIGLIIANLFGSILAYMGWFGKLIWVLGTILLGYLGMSLGVKKREEIFVLFTSIPRFTKDKIVRTESKLNTGKLLDTSVIIDGRIADLCESGFIEGTLLVPVFVLEELRHIADSPDLLKRNRGRRGLDILNKMQKEMDIKVQIYENTRGLENIPEVDMKLVKLAQKIGCKVMTNDYNLNKVAELHGVKVLNINELANAVKPVVLPGENMVVQVVKDGKEFGQGVAYLDDGTMIVVDGGKKYIGQTIGVQVTSVLQTAAGRMIFAKHRNEVKKGDIPGNHVHFNEVNYLGPS
ncbi:PIN/TRAM domain-containing protein [Desulfolucanica intricata]|uniref:PIN/TRAM domain-containing protein n=1 Tax=Desulfolucanica intricata TaxID=1285191 RepID=UPI00083163BB|nr:PIN/TRAM domain-containing protein [Desulfolucanica intricata]